jgi:hypothetical protein
VDVISTKDNVTNKDQQMADQLSKMKDFDFKKSVDAKLERLTNVLTRPGDGAGRNRRRTRLLSGAYQAEDSDRDAAAAAAGRGRSVPPRTIFISAADQPQPQELRRYLPTYAQEKLSLQSTILERKGARLLNAVAAGCITNNNRNIYGSETDVRAHSSRMHEILEQLRSTDAVNVELQRGGRRRAGGGPEGGTSANAIRAELDSFAAVLGKIRTPSMTPAVLDDVAVRRRREGGSAAASDDDLWTRLARTKGELNRLETLVNTTFRVSAPSRRAAAASKQLRDSDDPIFIFHDRNDRLFKVGSTPQDVASFITGSGATDYRKTNSVAEQAIIWAQERRQRVESELERERHRERLYLRGPENDLEAPEPTKRGASRNYVFTADDDENEAAVTSIYVPTIVRPSSSVTSRDRKIFKVDIESTVTNPPEQRTRGSYARSSSASFQGPSETHQETTSTRRSYAAEAASSRRQHHPHQQQPTSEVRRHVREVLEKYSAGGSGTSAARK